MIVIRLKRHLDAAKDFHQARTFDLDSLPAVDRARFCILYGTGEATADVLHAASLSDGGNVANYGDFAAFEEPTGDGDGTVPVQSVRRFKKITAHGVPKSVHYVWHDPFTLDDRTNMKIAGYHGGFLALDKNISMIRVFLSGGKIDPARFGGLR